MIEWRPWGAEAFAQAARASKPGLHSTPAAWCRACREMDRTTYADAAVAAIVHDRFVAVRVDADRRPDINERYNLGGWPTTAFLTPRGDIMTGGTFVPVDRMAGVLERVATEYTENLATENTERTDDPATEDTEDTEDTEHTEDLATEDTDHTDYRENPATEDTDDTERSEGENTDPVIRAIFSSFDEVHGGFGIEPKFPHTAPIHLAMALFRESNDPRWRRIVERTLDAIRHGA